MADKEKLAALVQHKKNLDEAARGIEMYKLICVADSSADMRKMRGLVKAFNESQQTFEARVAALTADERWQFMFTAMVTGAFEEED
jgi:hypothetical protein